MRKKKEVGNLVEVEALEMEGIGVEADLKAVDETTSSTSLNISLP